jgi:hypothetical protein
MSKSPWSRSYRPDRVLSGSQEIVDAPMKCGVLEV